MGALGSEPFKETGGGIQVHMGKSGKCYNLLSTGSIFGGRGLKRVSPDSGKQRRRARPCCREGKTVSLSAPHGATSHRWLLPLNVWLEAWPRTDFKIVFPFKYLKCK